MRIGSSVGFALNFLAFIGAHDDYFRQDLRELTLPKGYKLQEMIHELLDNGIIAVRPKLEEREFVTYMLARPASDIRVSEVFDIFEKGFSSSACLMCSHVDADGNCRNRCAFGKEVKSIDRAIHQQLSAVTIQDLITKRGGR